MNQNEILFRMSPIFFIKSKADSWSTFHVRKCSKGPKKGNSQYFESLEQVLLKFLERHDDRSIDVPLLKPVFIKLV